MNVESIRIIENNLNLEKVIGAMTVLDNCVSGGIDRDTKISGSCGYGINVNVLFDYILFGKKAKKWNQYVYDTFQCFVKNKTEMIVGIRLLAQCVEDELLLNLIFSKIDKNNEEVMDETNLTNMMRPEIFKIFENLQEIYFSSWDYPFSLFAFLSLITSTTMKKAVIYAQPDGWLSDLWSSYEKEIVEEYSARGFEVTLKQHKYSEQHPKLIINKL